MDGKLYLLTEAAELTGATVEALRQRIKRRKLQGVRGNDGRLRVRLGSAEIAALTATSRPESGQTKPTEQPAEQPAKQLVERPVERPVEPANERPVTPPAVIATGQTADAGELRHLAEIGRLQAQHAAEIGRLIDQVSAERSLWLERVDAAEIRAEKVENKLDRVLEELLTDRRRSWWARLWR